MKKISQSFIKDMREYVNGDLCGNLIKEQWVNDRFLDLTKDDAAALGRYFEYLLTGALPKDGKVPEPERTQKGELTAPYKLVEKNVARVRTYLNKWGLKIVEFGRRKTKGRFEGTIDLIVECLADVLHSESGIVWRVGDRMVFDLKYSGLINDKWSPYGWNWTEDQKRYHRTQAIHYNLITNLPFYYLVTSSKNENDIDCIHVEINEQATKLHISEANMLHEKFLFLKDIGFEVRPSLAKCLACPLKDECKDKAETPSVRVVSV